MAVSPEYRSKPEDLPAPSAELVLWRVAVEAFLDTMPRKKGEAFLIRMGELLASEEAVSNILPIRPDSETEMVQAARVQAVAMFRQYLRVFMARLR